MMMTMMMIGCWSDLLLLCSFYSFFHYVTSFYFLLHQRLEGGWSRLVTGLHFTSRFPLMVSPI